MHRRRQALGAVWDEHRRTELPRSLRAAGPAYKPAALRSLDVCLDSRGPFIDTYYMEPKTALERPSYRRATGAGRAPAAQRPWSDPSVNKLATTVPSRGVRL